MGGGGVGGKRGRWYGCQVSSPSGKELQVEKAASEGRVDFTAEEDGEYSFCFKGAKGGKTDVKFWVNTETDFGLADLVKEGMWMGSFSLLFAPPSSRHHLESIPV